MRVQGKYHNDHDSPHTFTVNQRKTSSIIKVLSIRKYTLIYKEFIELRYMTLSEKRSIFPANVGLHPSLQMNMNFLENSVENIESSAKQI